MSRISYRGYSIEIDMKPIPFRGFDFDFWHDDYDGPGDNRHGAEASIEACKARIDEIEDDE